MILHTFAKRGTSAVVLAILFLWDLEPSTGGLVEDAFTAVVLVLHFQCLRSFFPNRGIAQKEHD